MLFVSIAVFIGCSKEATAPVASTPIPAPVAAKPAPEEEPVALPTTPQGFYEQCEGRVEGPGEAGECTTDADCAKAGCSQEMCVASASAEGLTTTCDLAPCFKVLDTCGCREGLCSWSLKAELPEDLQKFVETVNGQ